MATVTVDGLTLEGYNEQVHGWPGDPFTAHARKDVVLDDGTRAAFHLAKWSLMAHPADGSPTSRVVWGTVLLTNSTWGDWRLVRAYLSGGVWGLGVVIDQGATVVSPQPRPDWMDVA